MVERWESAERILAFLAAVESIVPPPERDDALVAWFTWGRQYARSLSPLGGAPLHCQVARPSHFERLRAAVPAPVWYGD